MQIVRLLTQYMIDTKATNSNNLTALGILQGENQEDSVNNLRRAQNLRAFFSVPLHFLELASSNTNRHLPNHPKPPGGVFQADYQPKDNISSLQINSGSHKSIFH